VSFPRIVAGRGAEPAAPGAICALALRLRDHALSRALIVGRIELSRIRSSSSRYIHLNDPFGRPWSIRVSNHHLPRRTGHPEPHFDFVSIDGVSGFELAAGFVDRIARGEVAWSERQLRPRRKGVRR